MARGRVGPRFRERQGSPTLRQFARLSPGQSSRAHRILRAVFLAARRQLSGLAAWCISCTLPAIAWCVTCTLPTLALAQIEPPLAEQRATIHVTAEQANRWTQGAYEVWHLRGSVEVRQASVVAKSREAVLWIDRAEEQSGLPDKVLAYLEEGVSVEYQHGGAPHRVTKQAAQSIVDKTWFGRFYTTAGIDMHVPTVGGEPNVKPAAFERGIEAREPRLSGAVQPAQFAPGGNIPFPESGAVQPAPATAAENSAPLGVRRVTILPRSSVRLQARTWPSDDQSEQIITIDSGVRVVVEGGEQLGRLDLETDRIVIWTSGLDKGEVAGQTTQRGDQPLEFYLEGNIVFRQGDRVIYAERMYYNVPGKFGVILGAEVLTPVPEYEGLLRLKAEVMQQLNEQNFVAYNAAVTSSRLGVPSYWLQSQNISLQDTQRAAVDPFTGQAATDPATGEPAVEHEFLATSRNNFAYLGGLPVFYFPVLASNLTRPVFYIEKLNYRSDSIFGQQILVDFDVYELLGVRNPPRGTKLSLSTDYLSDRGFGLGMNFQYARQNLFGIPGPYRGFLDAWGIRDQDLDNLGRDRRAVPLEETFRGRILGQHRHTLPHDLQFSAEFGLISDRNFLEQYYEREWDLFKDQTTGVELKQFRGNSSWSITSDVRLNDFFTQTEWLPRLDHQMYGQSLLWDRLVWHEHTHAGYAKLRVASTPTNPVDLAKFDPLAWEAEREGVRAGTRQEIDAPVDLGPVRFVPYVLGDATYWGEDLTGNDLTRLYGQVGIKSSLPMWASNPEIQSSLFNLNGLAHKVSFDSEFLYADASQDLGELPLYDPLDDDSQEHFRRRFFFDTFGGVPGGNVPLRFDERFYALRTGMQSNVSPGSLEIADDLMLARLGIRQKLQTKRGLPGQERIIDWMVLDVQGTFFPKPGRDNFGEDLGLLNYDFRWHVGDRFTILSDGFADLFADGLRTVSLGGIVTRPEHGNFYLGYRSIEGPISSNVLSTSLSYRMTEKWITTAGASFDFGPTGNIGQTLAFTRVGESFLVRLGVNIDASRGNFGAVFAVEPRFLPRTRLGNVGGVQIPPAGALGLE